MALKYKAISYRDEPVSYWDDETFFELGLSRHVPILLIDSKNDSSKEPSKELSNERQSGDKKMLTDSIDILWKIDELFPVEDKCLVDAKIDHQAWLALLDWRHNVDALLSRLNAPALLIYKDISEDESSIEHYKKQVFKQFNMSAEALANDRYAAYEQFAAKTNIKALGLHLSKNQYYLGQLSIADILMTADLYTLQCLDGVSMPIDILYYLQRVEKACNIDLQEGMVNKLF